MGLRQTINDNPVLTTALTVVIMASAIGYIVYHSMGHPNATAKIPTTSYFSDDEGKTWFIDDAKKVPPFDHNGKTAVLAMLFKCADGKVFVSRLEQFTPEAREKIQADINAGTPALKAEFQYQTKGMMIKKPGDTDWAELKDGDAAANVRWGQIMSAKCPDGTLNARPVSVEENAQP